MSFHHPPGAVAVLREPRAVRFSEKRFEAFRIAGGIPAQRGTFPLGTFAVTSIDEAVNEAICAVSLAHKDHLLIRESDGDRVLLHIYAIRKKSAPRYVHKDHVTRAVRDLYPELVCSIDAGALS